MVFSGRICSYLPGFSLLYFSGKRECKKIPLQRLEGRDFQDVSVVSGRDFPAVVFSQCVLTRIVFYASCFSLE